MPKQFLGTEGDDRGSDSGGTQHQAGLGGNDSLMASGLGDAILYGGRGSDNLFGADGDDLLFGGRGRDTLFGNEGRDVMRGGKGVDVFVVEGGDFVLDFSPGIDKLSLGFFPDSSAAEWRYDRATGQLFADLDGQGPEAETVAALLKKGLSISDADFLT